MADVDSIPFTPLLYTTVGDKTDSAWLKKEDLKPLLQSFFVPEIDSTNLINFFTETKFNDQTIHAITLTYEPTAQLPDTFAIRSWNVYINPETGNVTSIYILKQYKENNQSFTQQLTWKTGKSATITTIHDLPDGNSELVKKQKIIWSYNQ